jgi:hypothetical protein
MQRSLIAFLFAIFLIVLPSGVAADETVITLGGSAGWPALSSSTGLAHGKGRLGQDALVLSSVLPSDRADSRVASALPPAMQTAFAPSGQFAANPAGKTDLFLSFDDEPFADAAGNYDVVSSTFIRAGKDKARRGSGAALCDSEGKGLVLRGKNGALFSTPGETTSFSIEFWLYPAVIENGSTLFLWRSARAGRPESLYQFIRASLFRNHLEWTFSNIWTTTAGKPIDVTIAGKKNLVPRVWTHHVLSYDADSGIITYWLDGSTEDIRYVTSTGSESGDVYPALFGPPADVEIAPEFSGLIDEFRIVRAASGFDSLDSRYEALERYPAGGGRFESMPIDSGGLESTLNSISAVVSEPSSTGTAFFVRAGDNFYQWTDEYPAWIPVEPGKKIKGVVGRYFQVAGELYPDGTGSATPTVTSVSLHYEKDTLPWPPSKVFATAGSGEVTLRWVASIDFDAAGYLVYYGDHPGEYFGAGVPIDAGKSLSYTVSGLKNGKVYYFCVAAYDASGPRFPGTLSGEVYARPLAVRE